MASKTYRAGQEAELARDLKKYARRMLLEYAREVHAESRRFAEARSTDNIRGRWGDRIDGRDNVPSGGPHASTKRIKVGSKHAVINDHAVAAVEDFARNTLEYEKGIRTRSGTTTRPFTREKGFAPGGISEPWRRYILGYATTAAAAAIAEAERRFGR